MRTMTILLIALSSMACASRPRMEGPQASTATLRGMPGWYKKPPKSDEKGIYGVATATSLDLQVALNKAQAEGRAALAAQLESKFGALTRRFVEETGLARDAQLLDEYQQTYKVVVSQVLVGSRAKDQSFVVDDGVYRAWVLMELPAGEASRQLLDQIKTQQQMFTRFRATEAFKELNAEVEKYDAWKAEQKP